MLKTGDREFKRGSGQIRKAGVLANGNRSGNHARGGAAAAARGLGRCGRAELVADREDLFEDEATVVLYEKGQLEEMMVSDLARLAVATKQTASGGNAS